MTQEIAMYVTNFFNAIPFSSATWLTIWTLIFFIWIMSRASRDPKSPLNWEHLIIDSNNDRASPYKLGYLVGVIVSTWVVIRSVDRAVLSFDVLGMYLTFLVSGAGINTFAKRKEKQAPPMDDDEQ